MLVELKRLWPICDDYFYQRFSKVDSPGLGGVVDVLDSTGGSFVVYDRCRRWKGSGDVRS